MSTAEIDELRYRLHRAFKHSPLLHVPLCISWAFLVWSTTIMEGVQFKSFLHH